MKAVCLLSGGMDSATLAYVAKSEGYDILALHFSYGQKTENKEYECAKKLSALLEAEEFLKVNLSYLTDIGASSLTDASMPVKEHDESAGVPDTYVPFRNANLLSIATSFAEARDAKAVFIGVQASDYSGYPDCRPEFISAFQEAIRLGTREDTHIELKTPFVNLAKPEILKIGMDLGVPYEHTWSCYQAEEKACGVCSSCYYRLSAFEKIGIRDPVPYR